MTTPTELREQLDRVWPNQDDRVMMGGGEWATVAKEVFSLLDAALAGWKAAEERNESPGVTVSGKLVVERDAALQEVERLKDELDGVRKRASLYRTQIEIKQDDIKRLQDACATESHTSAWLRERVQHYEKSLREIAAVSSTQGWRKSVDIARAALSGSEPPSIPGFGDGMHGEDR